MVVTHLLRTHMGCHVTSCGLSCDLVMRFKFTGQYFGDVTHWKLGAMMLLFSGFNEQFHPESKQTLILIVRDVVLNASEGVDQLDVASS